MACVNIIKSKYNYGKASDSRNRIMDLTQAKYLTFIDGDDTIAEDFIPFVIVQVLKNEKLGSKKFDAISINNQHAIKAVWSTIFFIESLRSKNIRFPKSL